MKQEIIFDGTLKRPLRTHSSSLKAGKYYFGTRRSTNSHEAATQHFFFLEKDPTRIKSAESIKRFGLRSTGCDTAIKETTVYMDTGFQREKEKEESSYSAAPFDPG